MADTPSEGLPESKSKRKEDTPSEAERKSDMYYDDEADLEILSADGVLFRVHSYHLQSGS